MRPARNAFGQHLCTVVHVHDGDSFVARCKKDRQVRFISVRMSSIDAPEQGQSYGEEARVHLKKMIEGKEVQLNCYKRDGYQSRGSRHVCTVWATPVSAPNGPKTLDVEHAMLTLGAAWWYRGFAQERSLQVQKQYEFAQKEARARRIGLWAAPRPVEPHVWRRQQRIRQKP